MPTDVKPDAVLSFWFEETPRKTWFNAPPEFDNTVRTRFGSVHETALSGGLDLWASDMAGTLALILVLDQFSRNIHRGTPRAFSGDVRAVTQAQMAVSHGHDLAETVPDRRQFFYLPFTHVEDLSLQNQGVALMTERLVGHDAVRFAVAHRDVIARFGRFPHRNAILGRKTTPEEQTYLDAGGGFR